MSSIYKSSYCSEDENECSTCGKGAANMSKCSRCKRVSHTCVYRVAAWIGYYRLLPDIIIKFMNFQVAKCIEIMARSMEVQIYRNSSHKLLP